MTEPEAPPATVAFTPSPDRKTGTLSITTNEYGIILVLQALIEGGVLTMDDVDRLPLKVLGQD